MTQTIKETIGQLHSSLRDYIEATYHISAPALIEQRKELLDRPGVIHQIPYIESTPRYQSGEKFSAHQRLAASRAESLFRSLNALGRTPRAALRSALQTSIGGHSAQPG